MTAPAGKFSVRTADSGAGVPRVSVHGEIDMATAGAVLTRALREIERQGPSLILDLTQTSFMDSSGLQMIETLRGRTCGEGGGLALVVAAGGVRRLLEISPPPSDVHVVADRGAAELALGLDGTDGRRAVAA